MDWTFSFHYDLLWGVMEKAFAYRATIWSPTDGLSALTHQAKPQAQACHFQGEDSPLGPAGAPPFSPSPELDPALGPLLQDI